MLLSTAHIRIASPGTPKLLPKYIGPFKVEARQGPLAYRLELPDHYRIHPVFHVSLLKAYKAAPHRKPPPPPDIIGDEEEFEVEDILQHRQKGKKTSYLVKWTGYGQEYNSWEQEDCFTHAHDTIREYWARRSSRQNGTQGVKRPRESREKTPVAAVEPPEREAGLTLLRGHLGIREGVPEFKGPGAQGSAARPGNRPAARLSSTLQHMLGYEGVLQLSAGIHGCSSRVCEVCSHFDRAKVNTGS